MTEEATVLGIPSTHLARRKVIKACKDHGHTPTKIRAQRVSFTDLWRAERIVVTVSGVPRIPNLKLPCITIVYADENRIA